MRSSLNRGAFKRMSFLRTQLAQLQQQFEMNELYNLRVTDWSMKTLWGSPVLLQMHLRAMQDLLEIKSKGFKCQRGGRVRKWNWDFLLNLSETDFPVKSVEELTLYLDSKRGFNFLKFHSNSES